jgi:hypothetical protein
LPITLAFLGLLLAAGCSDPCESSLGVYPPDHIVVIGAETIEVPHIAWACDDFHADSIDPPPSVAPADTGLVTVQVTIEEHSDVEVTFGNQPVVVNPAPGPGDNTWSFQVPEPLQPLVVRICSDDRACAMYWTNLYSA